MPNQILTIQPYRSGNIWVFDDARFGLVAEAFVGGMTEIIDDMVEDLPHPEQGFQALFSASPFPEWRFRLKKLPSVMDGDPMECGTDYVAEWSGDEGWLCPALFHYFQTAPTYIYIQVMALPRPSLWTRIVRWWKKEELSEEDFED